MKARSYVVPGIGIGVAVVAICTAFWALAQTLAWWLGELSYLPASEYYPASREAPPTWMHPQIDTWAYILAYFSAAIIALAIVGIVATVCGGSSVGNSSTGNNKPMDMMDPANPIGFTNPLSVNNPIGITNPMSPNNPNSINSPLNPNNPTGMFNPGNPGGFF